MMRTLLALVFAALPGFAQIEIATPFQPVAAHAGGQIHLVYELHITNFTELTGQIERIEVRADPGGGTPLLTLEGDGLAAALGRPGLPANAPDKQVIGPGLRAIVFVWISLPENAPVPRALTHRLEFSVGPDTPGSGNGLVFDDVRVSVRNPRPLVLGPPLRGSAWIAGNGPSNGSVHRRAVYPFNGRLSSVERFAIDFIRLAEDGRAVHGDTTRNENWAGYGAEVLAVADGVVRLVDDGVTENIPLVARSGPMSPATSGGNDVDMDLGGGNYAFYAHLQPGSIRVKPGDRVRRGQVLGLLGNSGNSDLPHLHFQISTSATPANGDGLPFVFDSFDLLGTSDLERALGLNNGPGAWTPATGPAGRTRELPLDKDVLAFR